MTLSPTPRYDLLNIYHYNQLAIQISRGCPFNCEFCDIIELYGRKPRIKTPEQVVRELEAIRNTGYSGAIDIVDDNFIGNKRYIRQKIIPALRRWNRPRLRPFYFTTQASMNLGDDISLMKEMVMAGFRFVFFGIETPDTDLLLMTQKSQNVAQSFEKRMTQILKEGLTPVGGFIIGFDGEKPNMDKRIIDFIQKHHITIAMVGMLVALPNTQLWRRLLKENRLIGFDGFLQGSQAKLLARSTESVFEVNDQTVAGLNFITTRSRHEILDEFRNIVKNIYDPKTYILRAYSQARHAKNWPLRFPRLWELKRDIRGLKNLFTRMISDQRTRRVFLVCLAKSFLRGPNPTDVYLRLCGMFLHFDHQREYVLAKTEILHKTFKNPHFGQPEPVESDKMPPKVA